MLQKVKSIFLLMLFWLVILFPGYTQQPVAQRKACTVICKKDRCAASILDQLLKKILSSGISTMPVNEEERAPSSNEEETGSHVCVDGFILPGSILLCGVEAPSFSFFYHDAHGHHFFEEIPSPPPNFI